MIELEMTGELTERPRVRNDGTVVFRLRGMVVISDAGTCFEGAVSSIDAMLRHVNVGDRIEVSGRVRGGGAATADRVRLACGDEHFRRRRA